MIEDWKVQVRDREAIGGKEIFIYRKTVPGSVEIYNPITQQVENYSLGSQMVPGLRLTEEMVTALFQELQRIGMKPKDQSFVEGKFESQSEHLKDLRKLLKL